jgi:hypothetical protein
LAIKTFFLKLAELSEQFFLAIGGHLGALPTGTWVGLTVHFLVKAYFR